MVLPKGSKLQMQRISADVNKCILEDLLGQELEILCPIDFKEYQLNSKEMSGILGLDSNAFEGFWPNRQPQWDGIALGRKDKTLFLIEAKAHLSEIGSGNAAPNSTDSEQAKANYEIKKETILKEKEYYASNVDDKIWLHRYYQISNRLAFLRKVKALSRLSAEFDDVILVFLNFINDPYWISKQLNATEIDWHNKYLEIWEKMGIAESKIEKENIKILCVDVKQLK